MAFDDLSSGDPRVSTHLIELATRHAAQSNANFNRTRPTLPESSILMEAERAAQISTSEKSVLLLLQFDTLRGMIRTIPTDASPAAHHKTALAVVSSQEILVTGRAFDDPIWRVCSSGTLFSIRTKSPTISAAGLLRKSKSLRKRWQRRELTW